MIRIKQLKNEWYRNIIYSVIKTRFKLRILQLKMYCKRHWIAFK